MRRKKLINNSFLILIFIVISILSSLLLIHTHYLFGAGDMKFHFGRIMELESSLRHGQLFPMFSFNYFHGSAVMSLYPYLNILPIIVLNYFIKSNIALIYILLMLYVLLSLVISYYTSINISNSKETSFVFAIIYSISTPFLTYEFYDMDLGVVTTIAILPLVIFSFIRLLKSNHWIGLAVGLTIIAFSHVLSLIIIVVFLFLWLIANYNKINKQLCISVFKSIFFVLVFSSVIWIPAFQVLLNNVNNIYPPAPASLSGTSFYILLKNSIMGNISYGIGILAFIGIILSIFYYKKFRHYTKQMLWISIILLIICSNIFPWSITNHNVFKLFRIFQFTWRLYIIPELFLSYVFAICVTRCINDERLKYILIPCIIIIAICFQFLGQYKIIRESIKSPTLTNNYIKSNKYTSIDSIHHMSIPTKSVHIKLLKYSYYKTPGYPYYKISNNQQLYKLIRMNTNKNNCDYYPIKSLSHINYINNNLCRINNKVSTPLINVGFNKFKFNNKLNNDNVILPILKYRDENLKVNVNNRPVRISSNDSMIELHRVKKGHNLLNIKYLPNKKIIFVKMLLYLIGILWMLSSLFKRNYIKHY